MAVSVFFQQVRESPDQPQAGAPVVSCDKRIACDRLMMPGRPSSTEGKIRGMLNLICAMALGYSMSSAEEATVASLQKELFDRTLPRPLRAPFRLIMAAIDRKAADPSDKLTGRERALATVCFAVSHSQCEATQYVSWEDLPMLQEIVALAKGSGFSRADLLRWKAGGIRRALLNLVNECRIQNPSAETGKPLSLMAVATDLLEEMARTSHEHFERADAIPELEEIPPEARQPADPCRGFCFHFTNGGGPIRQWPTFVDLASADRTDCGKPDWLRANKRGMGDGVLTVMRAKSGTVRGFTFLTAHEGRKDFCSAAFTHHHGGIKSVVLDTPCMHAPYENTRMPKFFMKTKFTCDRFHLGPHKCRCIYDPDDYLMYDHSNTSLIEQWHSIMNALELTTRGSTLPHAMFYLELLADDLYLRRCEALEIPDELRKWLPDP